MIRTTIARVDNTLDRVRALLKEKGVDGISARHGRALFDRTDIDRVAEFHDTLKQRFAKDLEALLSM